MLFRRKENMSGKTYTYGWLDKVLRVDEAGKTLASFDYHMDGQFAQITRDGKSEEFLWDGLALIHRGGTDFINEPYITGGNPISSSKDGVMFNDMLGSTLNIGGKPVKMTAFGESTDAQAMYTGKPFIGELGYAFLFRNYRPDKGKWLTADPKGFPNGWNNLAYCNNRVVSSFDKLGLSENSFWDSVTNFASGVENSVTDFSNAVVTFIEDNWNAASSAIDAAIANGGVSIFNNDADQVFGLDTLNGQQYDGILQYLTDDSIFMNFLENYIPNFHETAVVHDAWVDYLVNEKGYEFNDINVATMLPAYLTALYLNLENTGGNIIDKITQWKNQLLE